MTSTFCPRGRSIAPMSRSARHTRIDGKGGFSRGPLWMSAGWRQRARWTVVAGNRGDATGELPRLPDRPLRYLLPERRQGPMPPAVDARTEGETYAQPTHE